MAEFFDRITDNHRTFIVRQPVFFVATAAAGDTRINLSPKGMDSFRVLDDRRAAYLDVGGSGNETAAHLAADGRITVMFCAFENPALIMRLYGHGRSVLPQDAEWNALAAGFPPLAGTRQIITIAVDQVQTSCGWGVPHMSFERERETLVKYAAKFSLDEMLTVFTEQNARSIDGLPIRVPTQVPR